MSFPVQLHLGPVVVSAHLVCELLAYTLGFRWFLRRRARRGDVLSDTTRLWVLLGAATGGLVGTRALGLLSAPIPADPLQLGYALLTSKSIVGGLLGGWAGVELAKLALGERRSTGDALVLPLCLAIAIGRVGCFLSGVTDGTHGLPSDLPWAMDLGDGVPRHPTALYEIGAVGLGGFGLARLEGRLPEGLLFRVFMAAYLTFRLLIDMLKPGLALWGGWTAIQLCCGAGLGVLGALELRRRWA